MKRKRTAQILLVEDNPADVMLTRCAFEDARIDNILHVVVDGEQAMQFLRREPPFEDAERPDLVILDLNLPKMDGRQVLAEIKFDESLATIPVVVLTTSEHENDVQAAYQNHANAYVTKPVGLDELIQIARQIDGFWLSLVVLPND